MAFLRPLSALGLGNVWDRVRNCWGGESRTRESSKPRRLMIDPLEQRQLLSVTAVNVSDVLVNQGTDDISMLGSASVANDNNGDFVVVWTNQEWAFDTYGNPVSDQNVYARYYTNAVQRVDIPVGTGEFALQYNGNAIEKLTISAGVKPYTDTSSSSNNIAGSFVLSYTDPISGTVYTGTVNFDESNSLAANALEIQNALRNAQDSSGTAAASLSDITVSAVDSDNYLINFGAASGGSTQTPIAVASTNFTSGFMPAAGVTMVRQPGYVDIPVSTDPTVTAANIEHAFKVTTSETVDAAPIVFSQTLLAPYGSPISLTTALPGVSVTARSATEFDVTFTGDQGLQEQPLMTLLTRSSSTSPWTPVANSVRILKQTSDTFRVNDPEPDDPISLHPDKYDQYNAQVAMDTDGDFVITWESVVADSVNHGSGTDIFARRFSAAGFVSGVTQDIHFTTTATGSLAGDFTLTTEKGTTASITFDSTNLNTAATNIKAELFKLGYDPTSVTVTSSTGSSYILTIKWNEAASFPQITCGLSGTWAATTTAAVVFSSNGNSSVANVAFEADMDYDGILDSYIQGVRPLGSQFQVNTFTTNNQATPSISMDADGDFAIVWASQGQDLSYFNSIQGQIYNRDGDRVGNEFTVNKEITAGDFDPFVSLSHDGIIAVAWSVTTDPNSYLSSNISTASVMAKVYDAKGNVLVDEFNVGGGWRSHDRFRQL